jgi:WD40 repeat protein
MTFRLRLLVLLLLPLCLAACSFPSLSPRPSPSPGIPLTSTPPPPATASPASTATALPEAHPPPTPTSSATPTRPPASATSVPAPTVTSTPTPTGFPLLRYRANDLVLAVAWSPDGEMLAVAAGETVHLVDAGTLAELHSLAVGAWSGSLAFSPDGGLLALAVKDGSLQLWGPGAGQLICRLDAHRPGAKSVAFSPDGRWLASTGNDAYVRLWDVAAFAQPGNCPQAPSAEMIGGALSVPVAVFSPDGVVIASVDYHAIRLREVASQRLVNTIQLDNSIFSLAYSPDGQYLVSGELGNTLRLWDAAGGEALRTLIRPASPKAFIWSLAFSPDGKLLAAGSSDASITLWDPASGQLVRTFTGHTRAVTGVAFSPDGRWLASGSLDATLRLWQVSLP